MLKQIPLHPLILSASQPWKTNSIYAVWQRVGVTERSCGSHASILYEPRFGSCGSKAATLVPHLIAQLIFRERGIVAAAEGKTAVGSTRTNPSDWFTESDSIYWFIKESLILNDSQKQTKRSNANCSLVQGFSVQGSSKVVKPCLCR